MLTLYYVSTTFLQSWRINKICQKISEQLQQHASIAFYTLPVTNQDNGFDGMLATSELCGNRTSASISQILWLHDYHRGCCVQPIQSLPTTPWVTFPEAPGLQPFAYEKSPDYLLRTLEQSPSQIRILLETEIEPTTHFSMEWCNDNDVVKIENYGKLIAWRVDSHLAVLIETNAECFTKLLINTFLQNHFLVNDHLTLLRIESVRDEGIPQPFEQLCSHMRKLTRTSEHIKPQDWLKHLNELRSLSVLANQATEFVYNKNRTEGKTGIIKPDLIPSNLRGTAITSVASSTEAHSSSSSTSTASVAKDNVTDKSIKIEHKAKVKQQKVSEKNGEEDCEKAKKNEIHIEDDEKTIQVQKQAKFVDRIPNKSSVHSSSTRKPEASVAAIKKTALNFPIVKTITIQPERSQEMSEKSPNKKVLKAKPTEIKKIEPIKILSKATAIVSSKKSSELERIAASKAAQKSISKSPTIKSTESTQSTRREQEQEQEQENQLDNLTSSETKDLPPEINITSASALEMLKETENEEIAEIKESKLPAASSACATPSQKENYGKRPSLKRNKDSLKESKPPNVLIYADSSSTRQNVIDTIREVLAENTYTIYNLTTEMAIKKCWADTTALLVVCGSISNEMGEIFVDYFLRGGKVLSLCSDILHYILPNYRTAEIREHELVQFSYDKWRKVKMMHHIFCFQPSPVKKHFSTESDENTTSIKARSPALVCLPRSIELMDLNGIYHRLDVTVLGTEETWQTPSLLLARDVKTNGVAVFSQVHLEINPSDFETDVEKYRILQQNEPVRREIFADLLKIHLDLDTQKNLVLDSPSNSSKTIFKNAYFLGRYEDKFALLEKLKEKSDEKELIRTPNISLKFCGTDKESLPIATNDLLPILIHSCPEDFSTVDYFDNLTTKYVGRLVIYAPIVSSSQYIIKDLNLTNGIAIIARQQTAGIGRDKNQWLSPSGCCMFSIQLSIPLLSPLGKRLSLVQHIVGAAIVNALKQHSEYRILEIGLKWPNDIYAYGINKIGGLCLHTYLSEEAIVNIGCGINLDNNKPTICINDMIRHHNNSSQKSLETLKYEEFLAMVFNEIERLLETIMTTGDFESFYNLYYKLWLHSDQNVSIIDDKGMKKEACIIGIDDYGYLLVKLANGATETVLPDGNSFDMLKGLISCKFE